MTVRKHHSANGPKPLAEIQGVREKTGPTPGQWRRLLKTPISSVMCLTPTLQRIFSTELKQLITDHLIGTSSHAPQRPMFTYTEMGTEITLSKEIQPVPCVRIHSEHNLVALHFKYDQARCRFVEWAQNEIAVVPDFHKRILFSDEENFWLNGYVNKQKCCIWSKANPQVYVETPLHPEKLTVWCALWAGGILLQKR
ncbi:hypothetical protein TNCV_2394751 [Trichonephila clavipes]|nr:hypothetical protein TNCV_2394751 [Trichonephila clavipes]